jgi:Tfp pilus assembly protein PilX
MNYENNYKKTKKLITSEDGLILVLSLLLLLIATVVGITALSTSTTNVMISGNQRLSEMNFASADSGFLIASKIIKDTAYNSAISSSYTSFVQDTADTNSNSIADFIDEILGVLPRDTDCAIKSASCTSPAPDITITISSSTVNIDNDFLYATYVTGGAIEFASGYEGLGKGIGPGSGVQVYYRINSYSSESAGSVTGLGAVYRYVP